MKKSILFLLACCLWGTGMKTVEMATESCFIVKENDIVLQQKGDCLTRHPPQSTFKIALSLIGFDTGILKDEDNPFPLNRV